MLGERYFLHGIRLHRVWGHHKEGDMKSSTNRLAWLAMIIVGLTGAWVSPGPALAEGAVQFTYRVNHSVFGDIGTYTNTVEPTREGTTVKTRAHFEVKMLGVRMYREDADRTERWQGNRLVSYRSVTDKGDGAQEVKGEARGNSFVINSPQGTTTAPSSVHPANPWSANFLNSNTMMRPDTGKLEQVRISNGQETSVKIDNATLPAVKYEVDGGTKYTVWLDSHGVPIKFLVDDDTGKVTFTLTKCGGCNAEISQLEKK
jgi:uncharacterized protein DUF6134